MPAHRPEKGPIAVRLEALRHHMTPREAVLADAIADLEGRFHIEFEQKLRSPIAENANALQPHELRDVRLILSSIAVIEDATPTYRAANGNLRGAGAAALLRRAALQMDPPPGGVTLPGGITVTSGVNAPAPLVSRDDDLWAFARTCIRAGMSLVERTRNMNAEQQSALIDATASDVLGPESDQCSGCGFRRARWMTCGKEPCPSAPR